MTKSKCLKNTELYNADKCYECPDYWACVRDNYPQFVRLKCETCGYAVELLGDYAVSHRISCPICQCELK